MQNYCSELLGLRNIKGGTQHLCPYCSFGVLTSVRAPYSVCTATVGWMLARLAVAGTKLVFLHRYFFSSLRTTTVEALTQSFTDRLCQPSTSALIHRSSSTQSPFSTLLLLLISIVLLVSTFIFNLAYCLVTSRYNYLSFVLILQFVSHPKEYH